MFLSSPKKIAIYSILCILTVVMNITFSSFVNFLRLPLFLDTLFTAALTFTVGLVPGLIAAIITWLSMCIYYGGFNLFIFCSIAEVILIYLLKPEKKGKPEFIPKEKIIIYYTGIAAKLMLLYIASALTISVLGGIIDYISLFFVEEHLALSSVVDTFKLGLIIHNIPIIAVNVLARIPINIVDRFIVIFGGYIISRILSVLLRLTLAPDKPDQ